MDPTKFAGSVLVDGVAAPLTISISGPLRDERHNGDFYCEVELSPLLRGVKRIYGIDARQASELARRFVVNVVDSRPIRDAAGKEMALTVANLG